jgi:arylsulfatase B
VVNYFQWEKTINGVTATTTTYATEDTANDAVTAIQNLPQPWFVVVSFNAPHVPFHQPPDDLCPSVGCAHSVCANFPPQPTYLDAGRAMIEAMDTEIGRVMQTVDGVAPNTLVIFLGDNGTSRQLVVPPFDPLRSKNTVYEGGVNIPLIIRGPGVLHDECAGLVCTTDLFATFAEISQNPIGTDDSISILPYFQNPTAKLRQFAYAEAFEPNGHGPYTRHDRSVRNHRYKLIRQIGAADELYDLQLDPFEHINLLPSLNATQQSAYTALEAELIRLGVQ